MTSDPLHPRARRGVANKSRGVSRVLASALLAPMGLAFALGACDTEPLSDDLVQFEERTTPPTCPVKDAILTAKRPGFTGAAAAMKCPGQTRNHLVSWESIRDGYHAAVNPSTTTTCQNNLQLLYQSVGLAANSTKINNACAATNLSNNVVTQADKNILSELNSSITNLRCGFSSSNSSLGGALDIPCSDQTFNTTNNRIEITGSAATQISEFFAIGTVAPQPPYVYLVNHSCSSGTCSNTRIQTSDCSNDFGPSLPGSSVPVFYFDHYTGAWEQLA